MINYGNTDEAYRLECFAKAIVAKFENPVAVRIWLKAREKKAKSKDQPLRMALKKELDLIA